jgi:hypothetical protein
MASAAPSHSDLDYVGVVCKSFSRVAIQPEYQGKSTNCRKIYNSLISIKSILLSNQFNPIVNTFSSHLVDTLTSAVNHLSCRGNDKNSITTRRLLMWKEFNSFVFSSAYKESWISLLVSLGMQNVMHLPGIAIISQHVARIILETLIIKIASQDTAADDMESELTSDEEQAVRFTAGYIVKSLKKKMSDIPQYMNILNSMHETPDYHDVDDDDEIDDDFLSYTKEWISKVDRGGLHKVNDETFLLFHWMELTIRKFLQGCSIDIDGAITEIMSSNNVMACWSLIASSLEDDDSDRLLCKIAEKWITVRGFSYAGNLFEQYKKIAKQSTTKKSFRKTLKYTCT